MADKSKIQWTDATWNPITGCSVVSPGCTNCYAMKLAGTRMRHHWSRKGLTDDSKAGPVWNGEVRLNEEWLDQPLRWRKPRMVFVCAHGDLFHKSVPDEWIEDVFDVMNKAHWHRFQVLTKRPERMREFMSHAPWPLPNVWLGVSVEDQQRADERIPHLLATPAAKRFVSYEPALGPVNFWSDANYPLPGGGTGSAFDWGNGVNWIIVGGESGPGARPFDIAWVRSTIEQCRAAGVSCFVKQLGQNPVHPWGGSIHLSNPKGDDMAEWPDDLRVREMPDG